MEKVAVFGLDVRLILCMRIIHRTKTHTPRVESINRSKIQLLNNDP